MLQIIYGNDRKNYRTFFKSPEISDQAEQAIYQSYKDYRMITNHEAYSSQEYYPESLCCAVSNLNHTLKEESIILCLNAQMQNLQTPCSYFHGMIFKYEDSFFKEDFCRIFGYSFVRAEELSQCDGKEPLEKEGAYADFQMKGNVTEEQLEAALTDFLQNEVNQKKTKWILDTEGDGYNHRAREVLLKFYTCLPWQNRRSCGFISYCGQNQSSSDKIRVQIYDRTQLEELHGYFDWKSPKMQAVSSDIKKYVQFLIRAASEQKEAFERELEEVFGGREVNACESLEYFQISRIWSQEENQTAFPKWKRYLLGHQWSKNELSELLIGQIRDRLSSDAFSEILRQELETCSAPYSELPRKIRNTLAMAELLPWVELDREAIIGWERKQLREKGKDKEEQLVDIWIDEKKKLEKLSKIGRKQADLKKEMLQELEREILYMAEEEEKSVLEEESTEEELEKEKPEEKKAEEELEKENHRKASIIQERRELAGQMRLLYKEQKISQILSGSREIWEKLQYQEENREIYKKEWLALFLAQCSNALPYIRNTKDCEAWLQYLEDGQSYLTQDGYLGIRKKIEQMKEELEQKEETLKAYQQAGEIYISCYKDLENYYKAVEKRAALEYLIGKPKNIDFVVTFSDKNQYRFSEIQMKEWMHFLLYGEENVSMLEEMYQDYDGIFESLMDAQILKQEHLLALMKCKIGSLTKESIFDYYMNTQECMVSLVVMQRALEILREEEPGSYEYLCDRYQKNPLIEICLAEDRQREDKGILGFLKKPAGKKR
ncbi:MAG: hypothetical protein Q4E89_06085 [Eubacteriales bacterium]|nr:hypothetical protein [Eubacteriales bacterium]